jgi:hypothetical protein
MLSYVYAFSTKCLGLVEKTTKKSASQSTAFQTKKNVLISNARKDAVEMVREGSAYMYAQLCMRIATS